MHQIIIGWVLVILASCSGRLPQIGQESENNLGCPAIIPKLDFLMQDGSAFSKNTIDNVKCLARDSSFKFLFRFEGPYIDPPKPVFGGTPPKSNQVTLEDVLKLKDKMQIVFNVDITDEAFTTYHTFSGFTYTSNPTDLDCKLGGNTPNLCAPIDFLRYLDVVSPGVITEAMFEYQKSPLQKSGYNAALTQYLNKDGLLEKYAQAQPANNLSILSFSEDYQAATDLTSINNHALSNITFSTSMAPQGAAFPNNVPWDGLIYFQIYDLDAIKGRFPTAYQYHPVTPENYTDFSKALVTDLKLNADAFNALCSDNGYFMFSYSSDSHNYLTLNQSDFNSMRTNIISECNNNTAPKFGIWHLGPAYKKWGLKLDFELN